MNVSSFSLAVVVSVLDGDWLRRDVRGAGRCNQRRGDDHVAGPTRTALHRAWGTSGRDVWAVGNAGTLMHFDGAQLVNERVTHEPDAARNLGASASDVWAVGHRGTIVHFNGTSWSLVDAPLRADLHAVVGTRRRASGPSEATAARCTGMENCGASSARRPSRASSACTRRPPTTSGRSGCAARSRASTARSGHSPRRRPIAPVRRVGHVGEGRVGGRPQRHPPALRWRRRGGPHGTTRDRSRRRLGRRRERCVGDRLERRGDALERPSWSRGQTSEGTVLRGRGERAQRRMGGRPAGSDRALGRRDVAAEPGGASSQSTERVSAHRLGLVVNAPHPLRDGAVAEGIRGSSLPRTQPERRLDQGATCSC